MGSLAAISAKMIYSLTFQTVNFYGLGEAVNL